MESCCRPGENYQRFGTNVWIYGSSTLVIVGTVCNIMSGLVMQRKNQRQYTTSFYLTYLAFLDTVILYVGLSRQWIQAVYGVDIRNKSSGVCKLHLFLMYYLVQVEGWLLSCVAIERAGAVWWPVKAKQMFTRRFAVIQVASFSVFLFSLNAHLFWTQALIRTEEGSVCRIDPEFMTFRIVVWGWIDATLSSILPFSVMITCNTMVVVKIVLQKRKRKQGTSQQGKVQSVTIMLLTVSLVFFLCTLPIAIYLSATDAVLSTYGCCFSSYVIWPMLNMLLYLNNTINFMLYCVSGRKFRKELKEMLNCKSNVVEPTG